MVDIEESGCAHDMLRQHGYAPVGKRGVGKPNGPARGRLKVVGALLVSCLLTVSRLSGSLSANTCSAGVAQD